MAITRILKNMQEYRKLPIIIGKKKLTAYIADSPIKQMLGLMGWEKLKNTECMFFEFGNPARYGIWMRNMKIPIDVIWLNGKKNIVTIKENLKPAKALEFDIYRPAAPSKFVIELPAGYVKRNRIVRSTKIVF